MNYREQSDSVHMKVIAQEFEITQHCVSPFRMSKYFRELSDALPSAINLLKQREVNLLLMLLRNDHQDTA